MNPTKIKTALSLLPILVLAGILATLMTPIPKQSPQIASAQTWNEGNYASWVWGNPVVVPEADMISKLDFAKVAKIKVVMLDTTQYVAQWQRGRLTGDTSVVANYRASIKKFLDLANARGIKVEALMGGTTLANPDMVQIVYDTFDFVADFNTRPINTVKFSGVHYDIEFYNQLNFRTNQNNLTQNFFKMVQKLIARTNIVTQTNPSFTLNFDISSTMDGTGSWELINWNGVIKPTTFHLIDMLEATMNPAITIMAYRNYALGGGGTLYLVKNEFDYVVSKKTKIWVGQETDNADPNPVVTFYGKSLSYVQVEFAKIITELSTKSAFAGISVHTLKSYQAMK